MNQVYEKLRNGKWSNQYLCKLAVLDHIRECLEKDNHLKAVDAAKSSEGYQNLDKELMDLLILLELYFANNESLRNQRLQKFLDKLNS